MLLRGSGFFNSIVDDEIQEEIVSTKCTADFPTTLEMDEELFVHKLQTKSKNLGVEA
jgi:hypothetical protein